MLALTAALLFSLGNQSSKRALEFTNSQTVTLYQIAISTCLYWIVSPWFMKLEYWLGPAIFILIAMGFFRPLISANLGTAGTRILGPTIASTLAAGGPVISVALGVLLLAEPFGWPTAIGTGGIVVSVIVLSWRSNTAFDWPLWALALPLGAALIRSTTHAFAKIALETIPSPVFVALVSYTVSLPLAYLYQRRHNRGRAQPALGKRATAWLLGSGLMYGTAVLFLNSALMLGELVVVGPIVACTPFLTLVLGWLLFNERNLNHRTLLAVLLVVPSAILITLR